MTTKQVVRFKDNKRGWWTLPVNPEEMSVRYGRNIHTTQILNFHEIPSIGNVRLMTLEFQSFFPKVYDASFCNYTPLESPIRSVARFHTWIQEHTSLLVRASGTRINHRMLVTDFDWSYRAGHPDDVWYSLKLIHDKEVTSKVIGVGPYPSVAKAPGPGHPSSGSRYTIVSGDTLWGIAKRFLGNGALWTRIWEVNKPMTSGNPNLIYPGEIITIPPS